MMIFIESVTYDDLYRIS